MLSAEWQPSHHLNQWWNIVNWIPGDQFQWNLNQNLYIFIQENASANVVWKWRPFCVGLNVLMCADMVSHSQSMCKMEPFMTHVTQNMSPGSDVMENYGEKA